MYIKLAVATLATLQPLVVMANELSRPISSQPDTAISNKTSSGEKSPMSDREKAGLRGPVQQYTEERTSPAFENFPARSHFTTTKYGEDGRLLQLTTSNSIEASQSFSTTFTYDSA